MIQYKLGPVEASFAAIIWDNEPLTSAQLVRLCEEKLNWKKSTTFTVLRRLCQRGLFQNESGTVTSLVSREDFAARQSREFVDEAFGGSLPKFLAAFSGGRGLTDEETAQLQKLIDQSREEGSR